MSGKYCLNTKYPNPIPICWSYYKDIGNKRYLISESNDSNVKYFKLVYEEPFEYNKINKRIVVLSESELPYESHSSNIRAMTNCNGDSILTKYRGILIRIIMSLIISYIFLYMIYWSKV